MVDQLPRPPFAPKNVGRALIEADHRTVRRTKLPGLDADRIAQVRPNDDAHVPLRDIATRIKARHVQKTRVDLVPSVAWPPAALRLLTSGRWDHTALSGAR